MFGLGFQNIRTHQSLEKWVFKNKMDESGKVVQNKAHLVAQGYLQQEGVNYDGIFALVVRLESIRILIAYASHKGFKLFQIDIESTLLNVFIDEQVFIKQPLSFENLKLPYHMFKLSKSLHGL